MQGEGHKPYSYLVVCDLGQERGVPRNPRLMVVEVDDQPVHADLHGQDNTVCKKKVAKMTQLNTDLNRAHERINDALTGLGTADDS